MYLSHCCTLALAILSILRLVNCESYWVDQTCTSRPGWLKDGKHVFVDEALKMAARASLRLNKASDTDFEAVYFRLFDKENESNMRRVVGRQNFRFVEQHLSDRVDARLRALQGSWYLVE